jgi:cell division protein FtsW (lipid II flippase)
VNDYVWWLAIATLMFVASAVAGALISFETEKNATKRLCGYLLAGVCFVFFLATYFGSFFFGLEGYGHIAALLQLALMLIAGTTSGYLRRWCRDQQLAKRRPPR